MPDLQSILIRPARIEEVIDLRWTILRAGYPRDAAHFEGDNEPTTHHFGAFIDDACIGCATILRREFEHEPAWQLRGMAVSANLQKSGLGGRLLDFAEQTALDQNHSNLLWCNARVPASGFYQRKGWTIVSDVFEYPQAGPHVKMMKRLPPRVR
ncbi:MAG TPA: GNAT family N-acetyltransferase [Tepidisphaeraceae bacterium]|jgi:GNAT superfamily N-acetyltransferase|nr:GNAT family N-acetyltransferase [Tepidisphaeraceae bacterium]